MYTITDVKELHEWMVQHFSDFPLFQQVPENELVRILLLQLNNNFCGRECIRMLVLGLFLQSVGSFTFGCIFKQITTE